MSSSKSSSQHLQYECVGSLILWAIINFSVLKRFEQASNEQRIDMLKSFVNAETENEAQVDLGS